jgi:hypothetical protein
VIKTGFSRSFYDFAFEGLLEVFAVDTLWPVHPSGQVLWPTVQSFSLRAARWVSLTAPGETRQIGLLLFRRCLLRRFHVQISHQPEQRIWVYPQRLCGIHIAAVRLLQRLCDHLPLGFFH